MTGTALAASFYGASVSPQTTEIRKAEKKAFSAFATESLPFGGLIHKDSVYGIARASAFIKALHEAALSLGQHTAAHIGAFALDKRAALAASVYPPVVSKSVADAPHSAQSSAVDEQEVLTVLVKLEAPLPQIDQRVRQTLQHPDTWTLYMEALEVMNRQAQEGRDLVQRAAALRHEHGTHMDEIFMQRINYLADQLDGLWMYVQILPKLQTKWDNPTQVQAQMQRALTLAPQSPFLWCALGEAQLQLDLPQLAVQSLNKAVQFDPHFARAFYVRGLAHLRLQQSALAENDLSAALELRPRTLPWLRARGAVRMVREAYGPMCEDFLEACALGDCDGLMTARKRQLCLPESSPVPDSPAASAAPPALVAPSAPSAPPAAAPAAPPSAAQQPPAQTEIPHVTP